MDWSDLAVCVCVRACACVQVHGPCTCVCLYMCVGCVQCAALVYGIEC